MFGFIDCSEFDKIKVSHDDFLKAYTLGVVNFVKSTVISTRGVYESVGG